jgi:hypothetical protein
VGDERAETYLRLLAEREFRRVIHRPANGAGPPGQADPRARGDYRISASDIAASAQWNLHRAGRILIAAGALDEEFVHRLGKEVEAALTVRSSAHLSRRGVVSQMFQGAGSSGGAPRGPAAQPMRIVPIGQAFRLANDRAPADLHFLSLVATPTRACIAVVIRMHWPADGSSADLELSGAGYHHLPYDQLWLTDDRGTRYRVTFGGEGGITAWQGMLELVPAPPPEARWLDLIADGTRRLIRLELRPEAQGAPGTGQAKAAVEDRPASAVDRLLAVEAETILAAAWADRGPPADPRLGEITRVLTEAGLVAPDSRAPGQLAALGRQFGVPGLGISAPAGTELPAAWASVIAQRPAAGQGREVFTPLATILPDIAGTRFALAGLSVAAGESYLHLAASGMPELTERFTRDWSPWFSWWVRDGAGHWHVAVIAEPSARSAGEADFRLRLVPPLTVPPDTIELLVTGASARIRAVVPIRGTPGTGGQ